VTKTQREQFLDLACKLSPENLCCDGEASPAYVKQQYRKLTAQWKRLEKEVGRKVTENEIWSGTPC
jgi:hypothetical protein